MNQLPTGLMERARDRVLSVREDPEDRYRLRVDFYWRHGFGRHGSAGYGTSELAFLRWEIERGVLNPVDHPTRSRRARRPRGRRSRAGRSRCGRGTRTRPTARRRTRATAARATAPPPRVPPPRGRRRPARRRRGGARSRRATTGSPAPGARRRPGLRGAPAGRRDALPRPAEPGARQLRALPRRAGAAAGRSGAERPRPGGWPRRIPPRASRAAAASGSASSRRTCVEYIELGRWRAAARGEPGVSFRVVDAFRLGDSFRPGEIDVITCTQSLHHFGAGGTAVLLAQAVRNARRGILFVDTARSLTNLCAVGPAAFLGSRDRAQLHDGTVSIRKSFVPEELWLLARCVPGGERLEAIFLPPGHVALRSAA